LRTTRIELSFAKIDYTGAGSRAGSAGHASRDARTTRASQGRDTSTAARTLGRTID
jgi:hypothetical protein